MSSKSVLLLLTCWAILPNAHSLIAQEQSPREQVLGQVNDLFGQIRSQTGANISPVAIPPRGEDPATERENTLTPIPNPFAEKTLHPNGSASAPKVQIDTDTIRLNVNGKTISIPRVAQAAASSAPVDATRPRTALGSSASYLNSAFAMSAFKSRDYAKAESFVDESLKSPLSDTAMNQIHAMILFQNGKFARASEVVYPALVREEPLNWASIQSLYGDAADYEASYQSLQDFVKENPSDTSARFLLAYHHQMLGHNDHARRELEAVSESLENDPVVARMLDRTSVQLSPPPRPAE